MEHLIWIYLYRNSITICGGHVELGLISNVWRRLGLRFTSRRCKPCADLWGRVYLSNMTRRPQSIGRYYTSGYWAAWDESAGLLIGYHRSACGCLPIFSALFTETFLIWPIYLREPLDALLFERMHLYLPKCCSLCCSFSTEVPRLHSKFSTVQLTFEPFFPSEIVLKKK